MKKATTLVCICALAWIGVVVAAVAVISRANDTPFDDRREITVVGTSEMVKATVDALNLLRTSAQSDYDYVRRFVTRIEQHTRSCADGSSARILLAEPTFSASTPWLAATLVHEARHIELYQQRREYGGQAEELDCAQLQLETLRRVRGSTEDILWLQSQDGTHFDVNRDGIFDEKDASLQNW